VTILKGGSFTSVMVWIFEFSINVRLSRLFTKFFPCSQEWAEVNRCWIVRLDSWEWPDTRFSMRLKKIQIAGHSFILRYKFRLIQKKHIGFRL